MPGEDAAIGCRGKFSGGEMPAVLHQAFEPGIGVLDDRVQRGGRFGAGRLKTVRRGLERRRFHRFDLHPDFAEEIGEVGILEQHADRTDKRSLLRDDVIAGDRRNVTARRGHAVDDDDQRLLVPQTRQRVEQLLGAGGGAARTVNMDDDGARQRGFSKLVERLDPLLIAANQARYRHPRYIGSDAEYPGPPARQNHGAGNGENNHRDGEHAPEGELAPHAAAVDDQVGIERHGLASSALYSSASSLSSSLRLSAVPRISPSVAPESEEPYCAIASFSSATSSALIETETRRVRRSKRVTRASTFWPTAKRSGRCSERSGASSERLMKAVYSVPTIFTSMPPSFTSVTSPVTTTPFLSSPAAASPAGAGAPSESCLMPSEMRSLSTSTSSTCALTLSPFLYSSMTCSPGRFQSRSDR